MLKSSTVAIRRANRMDDLQKHQEPISVIFTPTNKGKPALFYWKTAGDTCDLASSYHLCKQAPVAVWSRCHSPARQDPPP